MVDSEDVDLEYLRELQDQLGQNILELRELNHVLRAQYVRLALYLIPALVLSSIIIGFAISEFMRGDPVHPHSTIGGTLGVFGLFLLSELLALAFGSLQSINRGNRIRYIQLSAIHEAEVELGRAGFTL